MKRLQTVLEILLAVVTASMILWTNSFWCNSSRSLKPVLEKAPMQPTLSAAEKENILLDLNTLTAGELESLPGIGPVLAERIVIFREEKGGFSSTEELLAVNGIGEATYEKFRPYITVR